MKRSKFAPLQFIVIFCLLALGISATALAATFSAQVDRTELAVNETLTLTLTFSGQTMNAPDFSVLDRDFEILAQQQRSQLSLGFSHNDSHTLWILSLAPKRAGELEIPLMVFQGKATKPIKLKILKQGSSPATDKTIFLETEIDRQQAYLQSEVLLTLRLYTSVPLSSVEFPELRLDSARTLKVNDTQYNKTINGREYVVVELKYALFPEKIGTLIIPRLTIAGVVPSPNDPFRGSSLFGPRGKPVRLRSDETQLKVIPSPEDAKGIPWAPAKGISINQRWSRKTNDLRVGEPITRTITVTAQGLTGAQLPPLNLTTTSDYKLYPDQPDISENLSANGVIGVRTEAVALVPTKPGSITLPAVEVTWWDIESDRLQTTRLEAETLDILPAEQTSQPAGTVDQPVELIPVAGGGPESRNTHWLSLSLGANAVLLIMLLGALLSRRTKISPENSLNSEHTDRKREEAEAFKTLMACPADQPAELRERILRWSRLFWPEYRISTLADITRLDPNEALCEYFAQLDKTLYSRKSHEVLDTDGMKVAIKGFRKRWKANGPAAPALKPLYPEFS